MRILFTGASSFTGYWFAEELVAAGHSVVATYTQALKGDYSGLRSIRVDHLSGKCQQVFRCRFGDDRFLALIKEVQPDVLCHHGAYVTDYKSPDFDYIRALYGNTNRLAEVLEQLAAVGCDRVVTTGSVFEGGEGIGSDPSVSFSPYGLSKLLTDQVFRHFMAARGFSLGKFVIPNPFGPLEDPRFTAYLVRCWRDGKVAQVQTPAYIRDNIHVSLLAKAYVKFVEATEAIQTFTKTNPSGYIESQGAFAERFAREMRTRLPWDCELDLVEQTEFSEPRIRLNSTPLDPQVLSWNESSAWDAIAEYYATTVSTGS